MLKKRKPTDSGKETYHVLTGFTLVELVVVAAVLSTLLAGVFLTIKPAKQIDKARDALSQQNLQEIKKALDLYYQDKSCYPTNQSVFTTALNTNSEWKEGATIYMKKLPFDASGKPFVYMTDVSSACPQWNVLFARLSTATSTDACPLNEMGCTPAGYDLTWACSVSGITNCNQISSSLISLDGGITYPTASPSAMPSGTITPGPTIPPGQTPQSFTIAMPASALPQLFTGNISQLQPQSGSTVTLNVGTDGYENPNPITSVTATVKTDTVTSVRSLYLFSGTAKKGVWSATWIQSDTVNDSFMLFLNAVDSAGNTSKVDVVIR